MNNGTKVIDPRDEKAILEARKLVQLADKALRRVDMRRYRGNPLVKELINDLRDATADTESRMSRVARL